MRKSISLLMIISLILVNSIFSYADNLGDAIENVNEKLSSENDK